MGGCLKIILPIAGWKLLQVFKFIITIDSLVNGHCRRSSRKFRNGENSIKVLNFNTYGMPDSLGADLAPRISGISQTIKDGNYDIVILEELWLRQSYEEIKVAMPYVSSYDIFNSKCVGVSLPMGCSGLAILSRFPIEEMDFMPFLARGSKAAFDGEFFAQKGLGRIRIQWNDLKLDIFASHLAAEGKVVKNRIFRRNQTIQAMERIKQSDADVIILGVDLNNPPQGENYNMITELMKDSLIQKYPEKNTDPAYGSYGNSKNTYSSSETPIRIDYVLFKHTEGIEMTVLEYEMPTFTTQNSEGKTVSLSDHMPLLVTFEIKK